MPNFSISYHHHQYCVSESGLMIYKAAGHTKHTSIFYNEDVHGCQPHQVRTASATFIVDIVVIVVPKARREKVNNIKVKSVPNSLSPRAC